MRAVYAFGLAITCCLAAGVITTTSDDSRELRELSRRVDKLERSQNEIHKKIDERTLKLAEWFDRYHARSGQGYYHQNEIKRIR